jgi:Cu+-exporting ATPase
MSIGKAARAGVLVRSGEVLERLSWVQTVFLDKTGTLTLNELSVVEVVPMDGVSREEALAWAASLEVGSEHAAARGIVEEAKSLGLPIGQLTDFRACPGHGVEGTVRLDDMSRRITVGSLSMLSRDHTMPQTTAVIDETSTATYVGWDGVIRAAFLLGDRIRPQAKDLIDSLKAAGVKPIILSGDRKGATSRLAGELGVEVCFPECTPEEKLSVIRSVRANKKGLVAMVGDGINDAPAMAEADVGIAVGSGSNLAVQTSDVILIGDDLSRIPWVLDLSKAACATIRRNLLWAFGYNSAAITLAFLGLLHPLIAAAAMLLSSLSVIANSTVSR